MGDLIFQVTDINGDPLVVNMHYVLYIDVDGDDTAIHMANGERIWSMDSIDGVIDSIKDQLKGG